MFTGIVEEIGVVEAVAPARLAVACAHVMEGTAVGDSISVNGCCLTVSERTASGFLADLMGETLARTALGQLRPGAKVNLERALAASGRLGGHLVQGHVDATAEVLAVEPGNHWSTMHLGLPPKLAPYIAEKGSVALDGVSLTVAGVADRTFTVGLIPHTLEHTTLGSAHEGTCLNIEVDVVAKYVERLLTTRKD